MPDPTDFKSASRSIWEAMAPGWDSRHAYFEERARPVTERMIERLAPEPGQTVLDVAAGTGVVGLSVAPVVGQAGRVVVSDFAQGMVDAARRHAESLGLTNVECRTLDAERMDLDDAAVDGVVCRWGYMLLGDPAAAMAETRRVLRPGGRLSTAVFGAADRNPWVTVPTQVLREAGHMPAASGGPGILALGDPERLRSLITDAGFAEPSIDEVEFTWTFAGVDDYWVFLSESAGAIAMVLSRVPAGELDAVREAVAERIAEYAGPAGLEVRAMSLVAAATTG